jgi:hypothetical protein
MKITWKNLMKLMVIALICAPLLAFGCKGKMKVAEEDIIGVGEPDVEVETEVDIEAKAEEEEGEPLPVASLTLVRLDGKEMRLEDKPIPRAVKIKAAFEQDLSDAQLTAVEDGLVLRRGDVSLGKSFKWPDKRTLIVTPERRLDYGTTYTVDISETTASVDGNKKSFKTALWGDVNGDGYSDVIVGATLAQFGGRGEVYIFLAGTGSGIDSCDMSKGCIPAATISGVHDFGWLGRSVSMAGDVNADGYADFIVGAPDVVNFKGQAYIFHGSARIKAKFVTDVKVKEVGTDFIIVDESEPVPRCDVSPTANLSCVLDAVIIGAADNDNFGYSVSGAGDVNGDGYDDVIVGARRAEGGNGSAYVFLGSANGIIKDKAICDLSPTADPACSPDYKIAGVPDNSEFGSSVSGAGDVNGDDLDDVIVGAPQALALDLDYKGQVFVYRGSKTSVLGIRDAMITGANFGDDVGFSVSGAGDVNGDGFDDIVVGGPGQWVYVFLGSEGGIAPEQPDRHCDLSSCTPSTVLSYGGGEGFGHCVSSAGDVDGDGYDDIIVGAYVFNFHRGQVYVFRGSEGGIMQPGSAIITGANQGDCLGRTVFRAGDVNDDGFDDFIVGANFADYLKGHAYIFHGSGDGINDCDLSLPPPDPDACAPNTTLTGANKDDRFGRVR